MTPRPSILLRNARTHNLADVTVEIPHGALTVVTGVSGSGKSSLVFDTLHAAADRRYLETLSGHARRFLQRLPEPDVDEVAGLAPSVALAQRRATDNPRSTVGTVSGCHDLLRSWFAAETGLEPRDFSFVSAGACESCRGIGTEDEVVRELLVADPTRTLRQGALVPTTGSGYIVYSQVTVDVLDSICKAHGFDVDTPWCELSDEQRDVVFFGSDRIEVPFGKHSLESRMRWEGIEAKPRELGYYKGLIPTIADTLRRNRNENALRFARSVPCSQCAGSRLNARARAATVGAVSLATAAAWHLPALRAWIEGFDAAAAAPEARAGLMRRLATLERLGLGHLSCDRSAASLSGGEIQRLRLGTLATAGLAGVLFVFDEPSIGLHASEEAAVLDLLCEMRDAGNTVVVVEHSESALRAADHLIDLGPGAGVHGGRVLFAGPPDRLGADADPSSRTRAHYAADGECRGQPLRERMNLDGVAWIEVEGAAVRNLRAIDVRLAAGRLNAVAGVAGAGKSTLVADVLGAVVRAKLEGRPLPEGVRAVRGVDGVRQLIQVDQAPIGRTPRSNPATYTGLFDAVRKCFAAEPAAVEQGFKASTFSFNTKGGGRCPQCEGAGREVVTMHGLPEVELVCHACAGRRFRDDVLSVRYRGEHSILEVLDATVDRALEIFAGEPKIERVLAALQRVGLGYLTLGQPATTLSGGEAQRVKLATELAKSTRGRNALFLLDEPTIGLHREDIARLMTALDELVRAGHTVVVVEHDLDVLRGADIVLDLGPGAGPEGGTLCGAGTAEELAERGTPTGVWLSREHAGTAGGAAGSAAARPRPAIQLRGAATHNLQRIDVDLPATGLTVVTGVSGSGKSSLVFDTLYGASRARFTEHLSGHVQRQLGADGVRGRVLDSANGLRPAIALRQQTLADPGGERRSTAATAADVHPLLRTLWSRAGDGTGGGERLPAAAFSFFRREGACTECGGAGAVRRCDPERLIVEPNAPLFAGALDVRNAVVRGYGDPQGKYAAMLAAVGAARGLDFDQPWAALDDDARAVAMHGCGEEEFDAVWEHVAAEGNEPHRWRAAWPGLAGEIDREYARRSASGAKTRRAAFEELLSERPCAGCDGDRLQGPARAVQFGGWTLPGYCRLEIAAALDVVERGFELAHDAADAKARSVLEVVRPELSQRLRRLVELGLGHLQLDRPMATLSAGERQRVRLARQLTTPLYGAVYLLDEPTLGLHAEDTGALLAAMRALVDAGNAVITVEHDLDIIAAADHVVELGPGAGALGGEVIAEGPPGELPPDSRTGRWLTTPGGPLPSVRDRARESVDLNRSISVEGADVHTLRDVDVVFPRGCLTAVTGVSGSGKTSLVRGVLGASARAARPVGCAAIKGLEVFDSVLDDAGARPQRMRASCPAVWLGVADALRKQFAATPAAKARGWRPGHFNYLSKSGGACDHCGGLGRTRSEFDFLGAGLWQPCEQCGGRRFDRETCAILWSPDSKSSDAGIGMDGVLGSTVDEFVEFCGAALDQLPQIAEPLRVARDLGLGYLRLGQGADTLSGGEAQRLALAAHLCKERRGAREVLFLLDEPTRGLHPDDVVALVAALRRLVDAGHTIVAVEHDLVLIAAADYVMDLGPGAGSAGGSVVFSGPVVELVECAESPTGRALRRRASRGANRDSVEPRRSR